MDYLKELAWPLVVGLFSLGALPALKLLISAVASYLDAHGAEISEPTKDLVSDRIVMAVEQLAKRFGWKGEEKLQQAIARLMDRIPGVSTEEAHELAEASVLRMKNGLEALAEAMMNDEEPPPAPKSEYL